MDKFSNPADDLNNNLEFLKTPVKSFAKLDYKKLQTFVAAMGLPSNLKRKQLLAIIVAKKMGKDNMIPAILNEVTRQRNQKKKYVCEIITRHKLDYANRDANSKINSPKFAPLPPQVSEENTPPVAPKSVNPQYLTSVGLAPTPLSHFNYQYYQSCQEFENPNQTSELNFREKHAQYLRDYQNRQYSTPKPPGYHASSTVTSAFERVHRGDPPAYDFFDNVIAKQYETSTTQTIITCREILHMEPATSTTPWYHQPLSCSVEFKSRYILPNDSQTAGQASTSTMPQESEDSKLNACKNRNQEYNLDAILDYYVMDDKKPVKNIRNEYIDENSRDSDSSHLEINLDVDSNSSQVDPDPEATRSSFESDTESSNSIHEMMLLYYALLTNRALWPLKRYTITCDGISEYIFDCLSPINSDTNTCYSQSFCGLSHPFEIYSNFKPKACMYNDSYASQNAESNVPERCLLQPENSLSYGVPKMYYRSRNYSNEYNSSYALNNYCFQPNQQEDMSRFAYASPQIQYNILLPNERAAKAATTASTSFVDLKPRVRVAENPVLNVEATIAPLSPEEELVAYNSLDDINSINLPQDASQQIYKAEHESQCCNTKISCPFLITYCYWFENVPLMAKHIREMHSEKIVSKKSAEYFINFVQLEMLKDRGVKIIQEYNNRLCYISLCIFNAFVCITVQELCESFEYHGDKLKAGLLLKHSSGHRFWSGYINSMIFPVSHLWKYESALMVPTIYLKSGQAKHFRLQVDLGI